MELVADDFLARLGAYVRRRVPSSADAEDVVQTVLLRLLEARGERAPASAHAWLLAAARRAIVDLHRRRARIDASAEPPEPHEPAVPDAEDPPDVAACLAPLLATLPDAERRLLLRVDVEGASQAELARELGLSASGLKSRVQRARTRLREAVLARCILERDVHGQPLGGATCRSGSATDACGCDAS